MIVDNTYSAPKKQWKKWDDRAKYVFNRTYSTIVNDQRLFSHPKADWVDSEYWQTTAWNAAWMAADYAREYDRT